MDWSRLGWAGFRRAALDDVRLHCVDSFDLFRNQPMAVPAAAHFLYFNIFSLAAPAALLFSPISSIFSVAAPVAPRSHPLIPLFRTADPAKKAGQHSIDSSFRVNTPPAHPDTRRGRSSQPGRRLVVTLAGPSRSGRNDTARVRSPPPTPREGYCAPRVRPASGTCPLSLLPGDLPSCV
eukprot:gene16074-biopygen21765